MGNTGYYILVWYERRCCHLSPEVSENCLYNRRIELKSAWKQRGTARKNLMEEVLFESENPGLWRSEIPFKDAEDEFPKRI